MKKALTTAGHALVTTGIVAGAVLVFLVAISLLTLFAGWVEGTGFGVWLGEHGRTIIDYTLGAVGLLVLARLVFIFWRALHKSLWKDR